MGALKIKFKKQNYGWLGDWELQKLKRVLKSETCPDFMSSLEMESHKLMRIFSVSIVFNKHPYTASPTNQLATKLMKVKIWAQTTPRNNLWWLLHSPPFSSGFFLGGGGHPMSQEDKADLDSEASILRTDYTQPTKKKKLPTNLSASNAKEQNSPLYQKDFRQWTLDMLMIL